MKHILIVEDETVIRNALKRLLENNDYRVTETASVDEARQKLQSHIFDLVISDLRLPGSPGTDLIREAGETPVLIMTSYASLRSAVDTMKMGAVDYIAKPFDHEDLLDTVSRIIEQFSVDHDTTAASTDQNTVIDGIIGQCQSIKTVFTQIKKAAPTDCNVLILGETGTGKELFARAIHNLSSRKNHPMICVNCAAIPDTLIESELFGYKKGAFTGANTNRIGLVEAADKGTLFLDEVGELPLEAQARLLRFLQEGEIRRIGAVDSQTVDVRVVTATHRDLKKLSREGGFRQDLFFRLNVMPISLPPLRERGKDILTLAEIFLHNFCEKMYKPAMAFTPRAIQALTTYQWPGNIRELENVIERAVILSDGQEIDSDALNIDLELVSIDTLVQENGSGDRRKKQFFDSTEEEGLSLEDYFQRFILEHQEYMSETELAQKLGVSRKCLWERRQRLGIPRKKSQSGKQVG